MKKTQQHTTKKPAKAKRSAPIAKEMKENPKLGTGLIFEKDAKKAKKPAPAKKAPLTPKQKRQRQMSEKAIEKAIRTYAEKKKVLVFKFVSPGNRGVPDRIFMFAGRVLFIEVKRAGKKPTALQEFTLKRINNNGVPAIFVDNVNDGHTAIDQLVLGPDSGQLPLPFKAEECGCGMTDKVAPAKEEATDDASLL